MIIYFIFADVFIYWTDFVKLFLFYIHVQDIFLFLFYIKTISYHLLLFFLGLFLNFSSVVIYVLYSSLLYRCEFGDVILDLGEYLLVLDRGRSMFLLLIFLGLDICLGDFILECINDY